MTGAEFQGVDLDLLADYVGGALVGTPDEERVASLIADDPAWQAAFDELAPAMAAVGTALLELPPEPMPGELAAQLDALFRPPATESTEPVPAKVLDFEAHRRDRARRWSRWAKPVAVAAGVVAFAGVGLTQISDSASDDSAQSTAADGAVGNAEIAAAGSMIESMPAQILHSDTDYGAAALGKSVPQNAGKPVPPAGSTARSDTSAETYLDKGGALARLLAPDALVSCIEMIAQENAGGPVSVLLVDYARFQGAPALIVRFTAANGGWTWAVGPDCGTPEAGAATLGKVPVR